MIKRILSSFSAILFTIGCIVLSSSVALAQKTGLSFIRDAEIEHTLRSYASPLFTAAGLNSEDVSIHLVQERTINAFVAGGQRMFFFTGLLERVETPGQLKGIIAHETGHIAGGHLAATQEALKNASTKSIIGFILGAAAIVASGGKGGAAVLAGTSSFAQKSFLKYSRAQESAADQAAMSYLDSTGISGLGMLDFLNILNKADQINYGKVDPYWRSHPIGSDRISALQTRVNQSNFRDIPDPEKDIIALKRIQAKLYGYTHTLQQTLKEYPVSDQSIYGRYARAIAYFRLPDINKATVEISSLLSEFPSDPYFHELNGQMLYENGDIINALPSLKLAAAYSPYEPLVLTLYGTALLSTGDPEDTKNAIDILKASISYDPNSPGTWNQLAIAHSRLGDTANLALATAERFLLIGQLQKAIFHAKRAQDHLPAGSPRYLRADDIITLAGQFSDKKYQ